MALTGIGKTEALKGAAEKMKFVGLFKWLEKKTLAVELTSGAQFEANSATNLANKKAVIFTKVNGKTGKGEGAPTSAGTGLNSIVVGRVYYLVGVSTAKFELQTELGVAGSLVTPSEHIKATTETEFYVIEECTESAKRAKTKFEKDEFGSIEDTEKPKIKVAAATSKILWAGWFSVEKASEETTVLEKMFALEELAAEESFGAAGEYELTSDKLSAANFQYAA